MAVGSLATLAAKGRKYSRQPPQTGTTESDPEQSEDDDKACWTSKLHLLLDLLALTLSVCVVSPEIFH
jgi:hypothetical protein